MAWVVVVGCLGMHENMWGGVGAVGWVGHVGWTVLWGRLVGWVIESYMTNIEGYGYGCMGRWGYGWGGWEWWVVGR